MKHSHFKIASIGISVVISLLFASVAGQSQTWRALPSFLAGNPFNSEAMAPSPAVLTSSPVSTGRIWKFPSGSTFSPSEGWRARMEVWDRATGQLTSQFYAGQGYTQQTPLSGCGTEVHGRAVAYDPTDGNLWITVGIGFNGGDACGDGWIHKIPVGGGPDITRIPDPTMTPGAGFGSGFNGIGALDYDPVENVLYGISSDQKPNAGGKVEVFKIDANSGTVINHFLIPGLGYSNRQIAIAYPSQFGGQKVLQINNGYVDINTGAILVGPGLYGWDYSGVDYDQDTGEGVAFPGSSDDISLEDPNHTCDRSTIQAPPTQSVSTSWPLDVNGADPNWSMLVQMTSNDGLVLRNIKLGQRYLAEKISVPYYYLETSALPKTRGELKPDGLDPQRRSRLVNFYTTADDEKLVIEATYVIDQIPAGSESCLSVTQRYEFHRTKSGDNCEPSSTLPCSRWKPIVKYQFSGRNGEILRSFNIAQRQHQPVDNNSYNSVGLFRDTDGLPEAISYASGFARKYNPLMNEWYDPIVIQGKDAQRWDNVHQTFRGIIEEPGIGIDGTPPFVHVKLAGCPECIHSHWRWGLITASLGYPEGGGNLIGIPAGSKQDVDFAVISYQSGEEDPVTPFKELVHYWQPIRTHNTSGRNPLQIYRDSAPEDVVYWQSATGYQNGDTFFAYGGFFNPTLPSQQLYGGSGSAAPASSARASKLDSAKTLATSAEDGISSIIAAQIYEDGSTNIEPFDAGLVGPLPPGYSQYSTLSYNVSSTAEASGPHTVTFSVQSATDQGTFDSLRILHLEQDPYAPSAVIWVDRTVVAPDPLAPDFANKTINAKANSLGLFVVASLTQPPNTAVADIAISSSDSPDSVVVGNDLTYTLTVANNGPQNATGVVFSNALSPQTKFVSVNTTQGNCSEVDGMVVCKLDTIAAGSAAIVTIVVNPIDGTVPLPAQGKTITDTSFAKANEIDPNTNDNLITENTTLLPDGNARPTVNITSPTLGALFVGPANINVSATASDGDGSISKVDFYGDGNLIGTGTLIAPGQYGLTWSNVAFGGHSLIAVATDNLNKTQVSDPVTIIVNGTATVNITSPTNYSTFNRPANVTVTANANMSGGTINKVDFYVDGLILLGTGTLSAPDQYSITWSSASSGKHVLTAVAMDSSNVTTTSMPVNITVNDPPVISLVGPAGGTVFSPAPASITLTANASDGDGSLTRVDFYANGLLIGTNSSPGVNRFNLAWSNVAAGNYSVTAVAIDNHLATKTSTPISVRVNTSPTVNIVAPSNGAQFSAPANITLTANASDTDGSVSNVDFFANGYWIGTGTEIGGGQYSFTWSGVGIGTHGFTAMARDNDGGTTSAAGPSVVVTSPVLFVTGSTTLNSTDTAVKLRLEALSHTVTVKSAASAVTADANGKALVVISSTVTPASVGTKFRTVGVPVLTWESGIYNNMGLTGSTNKDFGTKSNSTQVSITNSAHPLAAGFSGSTTVASSGTFNWGKPNANAVSVALVVGDTTKTLIFAYDTGAVMPGLIAPARRVGFFMHDTTVLNSNGTQLLDSAINWARGGGSLTGSLVVSQGGPVDLTTEGIIDWAHWGLGGPTKFDHKAGIMPQISDYTKLGTSSVMWLNDNPTTFSWIDGTPTASIFNTPTGVFVNGIPGNGFEITLPADANLKTLKLYLGLWQAQGKLEATLSDGSALAYVDTGLNSNTGTKNGVYTILFKSGSNSQILKIRYTLLTNYVAPHGNVTLEAATLQW